MVKQINTWWSWNSAIKCTVELGQCNHWLNLVILATVTICKRTFSAREWTVNGQRLIDSITIPKYQIKNTSLRKDPLSKYFHLYFLFSREPDGRLCKHSSRKDRLVWKQTSIYTYLLVSHIHSRSHSRQEKTAKFIKAVTVIRWNYWHGRFAFATIRLSIRK